MPSGALQRSSGYCYDNWCSLPSSGFYLCDPSGALCPARVSTSASKLVLSAQLWLQPLQAIWCSLSSSGFFYLCKPAGITSPALAPSTRQLVHDCPALAPTSTSHLVSCWQQLPGISNHLVPFSYGFFFASYVAATASTKTPSGAPWQLKAMTYRYGACNVGLASVKTSGAC